MVLENKSFNSKVLLFGEYSVIKDSMALSIPYDLFKGRLSFPSEFKGRRIDPELKAFAQYIKKILKASELEIDFDISSFEFDIGQGLYFESTIPQGYGVGSSGSLCAAVLDRYGKVDENFKINISALKDVFSKIESHFHGSSSGLDPLISYLNKAVVKTIDGHYSITKLPSFDQNKGGLFLVNTGRARRTEPLVNLFLEKCERDEFSELTTRVLCPLTNECVNNFLKGNFESLFHSFSKLSEFQYEHFSPMIPKLYLDLWKQGLESTDFKLKLCGAGGGGFMLGICKDFNSLNESLKNYEIRPLRF